MCLVKLRLSTLLWVLTMGFPLWAQSGGTEDFDTEWVDHYTTVQVLRDGDPVVRLVMSGGRIEPREAVVISVDGFVEAVPMGEVLPVFVDQENEDTAPHNPEGTVILIFEEGDDIDPNDPEGFSTTATTIPMKNGGIVIHSKVGAALLIRFFRF